MHMWGPGRSLGGGVGGGGWWSGSSSSSAEWRCSSGARSTELECGRVRQEDCFIVPPLHPHHPLQVGTGSRSEKIKTYNYKDSRMSGE